MAPIYLTGTGKKDARRIAQTAKCNRDHIAVTPFIQKLAGTIPIEGWYSKVQTYRAITEFLRKTYRIGANARELKEIFRESVGWKRSVPSMEKIDTLLERALGRKLTHSDRVLIKKLSTLVERDHKKYQNEYRKKKVTFDRIFKIFKSHPQFGTLRPYQPGSFAKARREIEDPFDIVHAAAYLRSGGRMKVWQLLKRRRFCVADKKYLRKAMGAKLTPKAWSERNKAYFRLSPEALVDAAYRMYEKNYDYPFSITAHELLKYKLATGCTHRAISFMSLAKAHGINDVRLVTAVMNHSYNWKHCKGSKFSEPYMSYGYIDSHKVVLARAGGRYVLVNTSAYPMEVVYETMDGEMIYPETLVGKDVFWPSLAKGGRYKYAVQRIRAVGSDADDYLHLFKRNNDSRVNMMGSHDSTQIDCLDYPLPALYQSGILCYDESCHEAEH